MKDKCWILWPGRDTGQTENEKMSEAARQHRRKLLGLRWPVVGFWLIEWSPRLPFQPRLCVVRMPWGDGSGHWSTYVTLFSILVTYWPYAEYKQQEVV